MNTIRQNSRNGPDGAARDILIIGGGRFGLAVAEHLTEGAQSVTFVSETEPGDITDGMRLIRRTPPDASDVRTLASAVTGMDLVVGSDSEALLLEYVARREFDPCESSRASRIRLTGRDSKGPAWISSTCRSSSSSRT